MKKKIVIISSVLLLIISINIYHIYGTLAIETSGGEGEVYNFNLSEDNSVVTVPANSYKTVILKIKNINDGTVRYGISYTNQSNIEVLSYNDGLDEMTGLIKKNEYKFIKLRIVNNTSSLQSTTLTPILGYENGGGLIVPSGKKLVSKKYPLVPTVVETITNLYTNASKTEVTNNSITYNYANIYDTDNDDTTSGGLMNDRLGGTTTSLDGGNIRYYGANPNNYIDIGNVYTKDFKVNGWKLIDNTLPFINSEECYTYFNELATENGEAFLLEFLNQQYGVSSVDEICGTTTIAVAGTPILYRIIGLFKDVELGDGTKKDLVKIIRNDSIGNLSWDFKDDYTYENNWETSTLQTILNNAYYNSGITTYNYDDYMNPPLLGITMDFSSNGLNSKIRNKIAEVTWNLGGKAIYIDVSSDQYICTSPNLYYSDQIYVSERKPPEVILDTETPEPVEPTRLIEQAESVKLLTMTTGTTGISGNPLFWKGKIALMHESDYGYGTDFTKCTQELINYSNSTCKDNDWLYNSDEQWLLNPGCPEDVAYMNSIGSIYYSNGVTFSPYGVRPTFFLSAEQVIVSGNGSIENPYKLGA